MAADITIIRAAVRKDLHDEDAANYQWTDAVLDRHIQHAVRDYSLRAPLPSTAGLTTAAAPNTRRVDLNIILDVMIEIVRVEFPTTEFPPRYVGYSLHQLHSGGTADSQNDYLVMDVVNAPAAGAFVDIHYWRAHTVDGTTSTVSPLHDDIIALGSAGYAARDRAIFGANRINTGGDDVWGRYKALSDQLLSEFRDELKRIGKEATIRQRLTYTTDAPAIFEQSRVKY